MDLPSLPLFGCSSCLFTQPFARRTEAISRCPPFAKLSFEDAPSALNPSHDPVAARGAVPQKSFTLPLQDLPGPLQTFVVSVPLRVLQVPLLMGFDFVAWVGLSILRTDPGLIPRMPLKKQPTMLSVVCSLLCRQLVRPLHAHALHIGSSTRDLSVFKISPA